MPVKPENKALYPANWASISRAAKERAGWKCQEPGCSCGQYDVGRWIGDTWKPHATYATDHGHARQMAAEYSFFLFGDAPPPKGEPPVIVIVLTTMHLDHDPTNCDPANLKVACQRHHLRYDAQHHAESAYRTRMNKRNNQELPL